MTREGVSRIQLTCRQRPCCGNKFSYITTQSDGITNVRVVRSYSVCSKCFDMCEFTQEYVW